MAKGATVIREPADEGAEQFIWIEPGVIAKSYWRDLWAYRELFMILAWRDFAVRYKQTAAGAAWAVVQPAVMVAILTFVFGKIASLPSEGDRPYVVMVLAGLLPWQFFANALSSGSQSILSNSTLISKVYFPRLIIPSGSLLVSFADFLIASLILAVLMVWYAIWPGWRLLALPALTAAAMLAASGPALITTALTVRYRDFRFVLPLVIQAGLYITPVAYSASIVRDRLGEGWYSLYALNPMVGVIEGFRWVILELDTPFDWATFAVSVGGSAVLCALGVAYFRRSERRFADVI